MGKPGGGAVIVDRKKKKLTVLVIHIRLVFAKSFTLKELFRPTLRSVFELPARGEKKSLGPWP